MTNTTGTFFRLAFLLVLAGLPLRNLWGLGTSIESPAPVWYQTNANQNITIKGLIDGGRQLFAVVSIQHTQERSTIHYLVGDKKQAAVITPRLTPPLKNITHLKMRRLFEISGLRQWLTLLSNGVECLALGDSLTSRRLKGGFTIYFDRPDLTANDYKVFIKKNDAPPQFIQPRQRVPLEIDGVKWDLYLYQFTLFDTLITEMERRMNWARETPVFDYDYILVRRQ